MDVSVRDRLRDEGSQGQVSQHFKRVQGVRFMGDRVRKSGVGVQGIKWRVDLGKFGVWGLGRAATRTSNVVHHR